MGEQAGSNTALQIELNKKRESELAKLKSDLEEANISHEGTLAALRQKHNNGMSELGEQIDSINKNKAKSEKDKAGMERDLAEARSGLEESMCDRANMEKNVKMTQGMIVEANQKLDEFARALNEANSECRNFNAERFRLKAALDEANEQLDIVRRENKNLASEVKDLLDQLGDGGRSIHELDKQRRRLEAEKEELQAALEEAESALEAEENKVLRAQLELGQVKQEIDRRIAEKEEEFNNTRKNHTRAMDSMQASLETEQGAKAEALRIKKKLEGEINELEIALDHANKANSEALKSIKRYQG